MAKTHWSATMEHCFSAIEHFFAANPYSFEGKAYCFPTNKHSFVTDRFGLSERQFASPHKRLLCGKATFVCGYRVLFVTKEVYFVTKEHTDRQEAVSLAITRHFRVLMSFNGDPDAQVEITANNVRTFEGGDMLAADFTDERGWALQIADPDGALIALRYE